MNLKWKVEPKPEKAQEQEPGQSDGSGFSQIPRGSGSETLLVTLLPWP